MNLEDLMDELRSNILHDRSDRDSGDTDFLWSNETLVRYIDEAQRRLARQGLILRDGSTAEVCEVTLVAGQSQYPLHSAVIAVISARYDTETRDLARAGHSVFNGFRNPDTLTFDPSELGSQTGSPIAFSTDEEVTLDEDESVGIVNMRVYPTPTSVEEGKKIYLRVCRTPINRLDVRRLNEFPEVPEEHHIEMLDWAAYLCLRIVDQDGGMPARANEFKESFNAHVALARRNALRKMFTPAGWGFGRGGFTWES